MGVNGAKRILSYQWFLLITSIVVIGIKYIACYYILIVLLIFISRCLVGIL